MEVEPIAVRGSRLSLTRERYRDTDDADSPAVVNLLTVAEVIDGDLVHVTVDFDADDMDAALAELDARYLAGDAAAHANTWSAIAQQYAAFNRRELFATTPDWVNIDHRRGGSAFATGEMTANIRASWDVAPDATVYVETVHRLTDLGAVITQAVKGTSREGFQAEWREIVFLTLEGDLLSRCEVFDDTDLDAALARFDELSQPEPRLDNAATRVYERLQARFASRDWAAVAEMVAEDHCSDDRRRVIGGGVLRGRDAEIASLRVTADLGVTNLTSATIAIRGDRLALCRTQGSTGGADAFDTEVLRIIEIDAAERLAARVVFDLDDVDAAIAELDARFDVRQAT
jgi:hypothetical protein